MTIIRVNSLKEGQIFSSPLILEDGSLFLPENVAIRAKDISFLGSMDVEKLFTEGSLVTGTQPASAKPKTPAPSHPPNAPAAAPPQKNPPVAVTLLPEQAAVREAYSEALNAFSEEKTDKSKKQIMPFSDVDPDLIAQMKKNSAEVSQKILLLISQLDIIFKNIRTSKIVNMRKFWQITASLLHIIKADHRSAIGFILGNEIDNGLDLAKSSVNIAILSAIMSEEMGMHTQMVPEIVAGALLHDVGMLRISDLITRKKNALTPEEAQIIASHPVASSRIMLKEMECPKQVCIIGLQHHERWDGSGYPQRLRGNDIDTGALIVSIADAFEAMVSDKSYRNSLSGYQAMKNLVSENAAHFSPDILKIFIKIMGIYPIGSTVELSDGRAAKIISANAQTPLRPMVQIIRKQDGQFSRENIKDGEIIDLLFTKDLYITKAVG
ncbi:MAG: HD-GYP domain-containing protein [Termitinemataceae bacterium]|nr:MAG: HD-GYP domain-containing protein [Termitinemataceae bacterium]